MFALTELALSISKNCSCRAIQCTSHVKTCSSPSINQGLLLKKIEASRHSNNCLFNSFTHLYFRDLLHLIQDHGRDFLWSEALSFTHMCYHDEQLITRTLFNPDRPQVNLLLHKLVRKFSAYKTLEAEDRIKLIWKLVLGCVSELKPAFLLIFWKGNIGWIFGATYSILDDFYLSVFADGHTRERSAKIDSDLSTRLHADSNLLKTN